MEGEVAGVYAAGGRPPSSVVVVVSAAAAWAESPSWMEVPSCSGLTP